MLDQVNVALFTVADAAQVADGKLNLLGAGWTHLLVENLPGRPALPFSVACFLVVPWSQTNRPIGFRFELTDADGQPLGELAAGEVTAGRPAQLAAGAPQLIPIAFSAQWEFPAAGSYRITALTDGEPRAELTFKVAELRPS